MFPPKERRIKQQRGLGLTQLDNVANNTHDQETHADGLRDAQELALVGCSDKTCQHVESSSGVRGISGILGVRLLHLVMNWRPSLTNSRGISRNSLAWSIAAGLCVWFVGFLGGS
jgi:hypothetical protein